VKPRLKEFRDKHGVQVLNYWPEKRTAGKK
jgi:hypothetical protein